MDWVSVIAAAVGGGGFATLITAVTHRRKNRADVVVALEPVISAWLDRLAVKVAELEEELEQTLQLLRGETQRRIAAEQILAAHQIGGDTYQGTNIGDPQ